MSKFKVGDRVKIVGPSCGGYDTRRGEAVTVKSIASDGGHDVTPSGNGSVFWESSLEHAPRFAVGDAVRVKAGSPVWKCGFELTARYPLKSWFGGLQKISASPANSDPTQVCIGATKVDPIYLEPWNDAEEWNGSQWVKKKFAGTVETHLGIDLSAEYAEKLKSLDSVNVNGVKFVREVAKEAAKAKPAIVVREGAVGYLMTRKESTNEAFRTAEQLAAQDPGVEYVVYQEKGSRKVEEKSKAEKLHEEFQNDINIRRSYPTVNRMTAAVLYPQSSSFDGDYLTVKYKVE